jgi:hypothetical protein
LVNGVRLPPAKIRIAVTANKMDAIAPVALMNVGGTDDALISARAAAHIPAPAPNVGVKTPGSTATPEVMSVSATRKTRNPALS